MVRWSWWDWSLFLGLLLPSALWHCWLGHLTRNIPVPDMTYNVFSGTLNPTQSIDLFHRAAIITHTHRDVCRPGFSETLLSDVSQCYWRVDTTVLCQTQGVDTVFRSLYCACRSYSERRIHGRDDRQWEVSVCIICLSSRLIATKLVYLSTVVRVVLSVHRVCVS